MAYVDLLDKKQSLHRIHRRFVSFNSICVYMRKHYRAVSGTRFCGQFNFFYRINFNYHRRIHLLDDRNKRYTVKRNLLYSFKTYFKISIFNRKIFGSYYMRNRITLIDNRAFHANNIALWF